MRGKLVSIEGIDGCGKSTHAKILARWLRARGYKVVVTDEPTNGPIGRIIKRILRGELKVPVAAEALLFAADRLHHLDKLILPAMRAGKIVITERYTYSSLAYQSARGLNLQWIANINEKAPRPDMAVLIDVPAEIALRRIKGARELDTFERDLKLQRKVRTKYLRVSRKCGAKILNGDRPTKEVQAKLRKLVEAELD
ncbi:MAG: dTMP kinase [Candidatus Hadarchaeum sp.]|nr:dTMP kinase [Candidatus Hadarchaeum sp.]